VHPRRHKPRSSTTTSGALPGGLTGLPSASTPRETLFKPSATSSKPAAVATKPRPDATRPIERVASLMSGGRKKGAGSATTV